MIKRTKKVVRKVVKGKALRSIENQYRLARASYANARFQWPARGMRVIMITGTNGKTTVAHFVFSILRAAGYSVGLLSTAEFKINERTEANDTNLTAIEPVALRKRLFELKNAGVEFVVLEATSQSLDQYRLYGIPCEVGVITNLTPEHLDYHKTMENYAAAKAKLWKLEPRVSVLNADDDWFDYYQKVATGKVLTYGKKEGKGKFSDYKHTKEGASFKLRLPSGQMVVKSHLPGEYNAYNALAAAMVAEGLGVDPEQIEEGIENLPGIPGRQQFVDINKPYSVVVDYAHTPDGLEGALKAGREACSGKLWLVFGSCGDRDKEKRPLMGEVAAKFADKIVLTDEESYSEDPQAIIDAIKPGILKVKGGKSKFIEVLDRKEAIKYALDNAKKGDLIMITGLGHERFRVMSGGIHDGKKIPWNDADVVKQLVKA